ncbi:MAG: secretin N-terminal domain-containing protein, partial [Planctomycetota bacterium]
MTHRTMNCSAVTVGLALHLSLAAVLVGTPCVFGQEGTGSQKGATKDGAGSQNGADGSRTDGKVTDASKNADSSSTSGDEKTPRDIRFQFDGIAYNDVVKRFAQMAKKPLIGELDIKGTLSYSDPEAYTYDEALDTLNLILAMKGFVLVETDRHLQVAPKSALPQLPLKIFRGTDNTANVRPGEVVTVVLPLKFADPTEVATATQPMLSGAGSVAPLNKGRGVIITDRFSTITRVKQLLLELDHEVTGDRDMKAIRLKNSSGVVLAAILTATFGPSSAPSKAQFVATSGWSLAPPDPKDYVTVTFDEATKTLVLYGPTPALRLAEELVERFESEAGAAAQLRIFYPQKTDVAELASMIRSAVPGVAPSGVSADGTSNNVRLLTDTARKRLIVSSTVPEKIDEIQKFIDRVDGPDERGTPAHTLRITRVLQVEHASARTLGQIIESSMQREGADDSPASRLSVHVDVTTKNVIVSGTPADVQSAMSIHEAIDRPRSNRSKTITKFYDVGGKATVASVAELASMIRSAVPGVAPSGV